MRKLGVFGLIRPFYFVFQLISRIFWSGLNGRNVLQLLVNFWINFAPVFVWLMIFKKAGVIPEEIRPPIHVKLAMLLDEYIFDVSKSAVGALSSLAILLVGSWFLYTKVYMREPVIQAPTKEASFPDSSSSESSSTLVGSSHSSDLEEYEMELTKSITLAGYNAPGYFEDDDHHECLEFFEIASPSAVSSQSSDVNKKIVDHVNATGSYRPYNCWYAAPPVLCAACWFLLNFAYYFRYFEGETLWPDKKDLLAWASYVLGHFFVPLFTAIWLYVFHPPGALKLFSFGLGMQNITGVLTHLLFPNAPPWFIHLKGPDAVADYDMPGYAAGLTRVDQAMGTHMHSAGFHKSPIVFGALPSLHSAMAVMALFFIGYYSRWTALKVLALSFVVLQWWATIYLDHHWRLDLLAGMFYSIASYTILRKWKGGFEKVDREFVTARLRFDFRNGSTMGMRVFRKTKIQSFFDPLS